MRWAALLILAKTTTTTENHEGSTKNHRRWAMLSEEIKDTRFTCWTARIERRIENVRARDLLTSTVWYLNPLLPSHGNYNPMRSRAVFMELRFNEMHFTSSRAHNANRNIVTWSSPRDWQDAVCVRQRSGGRRRRACRIGYESFSEQLWFVCVCVATCSP